MLSSYFVEVHTGNDYTPETYDAAAGRLVHMCVGLLSNTDHITQLTHDAVRESCHSELEAGLDITPTGRQLVAKVVVDIVGPQPIKFDKSKFTKLLKARPEADEWKAMKVFKRMVPNVPDFRADQ